MESWMVIFLVLALFIGAIAISIVLDRKRTAAIKQLADTLGFDYCENPQAHLPMTIWQFNLLNKGRNRKLRHLITGTQTDAKVSIGEYRYTTGSGENKSTHGQTVVFIESDELHLPSFLLTPENLFHKVGNLFGYKDIDFDSHPDFSNRYLLKGSDEDSIRTLFHDGLLNFYQRQQGVSTEGIGRLLIYYHQGRCRQPKQWTSLLNAAIESYEQFKQQY